MNIFRRAPVDPSEDALRRLSRTVRWTRPTVDEAPEPQDQLSYLARRLCEAIDRGQPAGAVAALGVIEEVFAAQGGGDFAPDRANSVDQLLTLGVIEVLSDWSSWPEAPRPAVATVEGALGPLSRQRWNWVRAQADDVARWLEAAGPPGEKALTPDRLRSVSNDDLRYLLRSSHHYVDGTRTVGTADRLLFEKRA